jgi:hypothetical protein
VPLEITGFNSIAKKSLPYLRNWSKLVENHWKRWVSLGEISRLRIAVEALKLVILG